MSTLRVTEIQSNSTSFNTPVRFETSGGTENGQLAKAWVNWNAQGTVTIRADFNVNTLSDNGQGQFDVNFSNAMPDTNYAMGFHLQEDVGGGTRVCAGYNTRSSSYMRLETRNNNNGLTDMEWNTVCFFR